MLYYWHVLVVCWAESQIKTKQASLSTQHYLSAFPGVETSSPLGRGEIQLLPTSHFASIPVFEIFGPNQNSLPFRTC